MTNLDGTLAYLVVAAIALLIFVVIAKYCSWWLRRPSKSAMHAALPKQSGEHHPGRLKITWVPDAKGTHAEWVAEPPDR